MEVIITHKNAKDKPQLRFKKDTIGGEFELIQKTIKTGKIELILEKLFSIEGMKCEASYNHHDYEYYKNNKLDNLNYKESTLIETADEMICIYSNSRARYLLEQCCSQIMQYKALLTIPEYDGEEDKVSYEVEKYLIKLFNNSISGKNDSHRKLILNNFEKYLRETITDINTEIKILKIIGNKAGSSIEKYLSNLTNHTVVKHFAFLVVEKFGNNTIQYDFSKIVDETKCIDTLHKQLSFISIKINEIYQALLKVGRSFNNLFKNNHQINFESICREYFWKYICLDPTIVCILRYLQTSDLKDLREMINQVETECSEETDEIKKLCELSFFKENAKNEIKENIVDIEKLLEEIENNQIKKKKNKKKKIRNIEDTEIEEFKQILLNETSHSFNIQKIKPMFSKEWINGIQNFK